MAPLVLHVWPGRWNLASTDPQSLAAILYLQLYFPGNFAIAECTNPDLSPSGQLPFLVHEKRVVSPLQLIIKYVSALESTSRTDQPETNSHLDTREAGKPENVAWSAHVESHLGDLVAHTFYAVEANWSELTHPMLVSVLPLPQRYYVPDRLRDVYRPRLEASGLCSAFGFRDEEEKKKPFDDIKKNDRNEKPKFSLVFKREKVLEKARSYFYKYTRLLEGSHPLPTHRPSMFDILLTAHLLLLLEPPFPDPSLKSLLTNSYPTLVSHVRRVHEQANGASPVQVVPRQSYSLKSLLPLPKHRSDNAKSKKKSDEDIMFERMRWGWIALAVGAVGTYLATSVDLAAIKSLSTKASSNIEVVGMDVGAADTADDE